jgi:uncharacterized membrane protein YdjX (TVP38/TMEM64 family)
MRFAFLLSLALSSWFLHLASGFAPAIRPLQHAIGFNYDGTPSSLHMVLDTEEDRIIEESRRKVLDSRRKSIRGTLKFAEQVRNFRLSRGFVPEVNPETGLPLKSDSKAAVTLTAFCVAAGAIALRLGGRAALISAVGLDFAQSNPELKEQLTSLLDYADAMNDGTELALFFLAWAAVKVFCFDAGGIVLALASGILFGGVIQGAVVSAAAATFGSLVCFGLAKLDTPVRRKALEVVEEYPSLRGIEKVVAQDGFKAILTLRLAPILPIPLGLYNYVYGVTNVPLLDFVAGIFLGSLKPYMLDSYLGYFGKTVLDGSAGSDPMNIQDVILLVALGLSVLIGVFASQLAGETWDTVREEVQAEKDREGKELVARQVAGISLPEWLVDWQIQWGMAEERMQELVDVEYVSQVWNYTKPELIPQARNPALKPESPEVQDFAKGFDWTGNIMDGLVLSPVLLSAFSKYADPLYDSARDTEEGHNPDYRRFRKLYQERLEEKENAALFSTEEVTSLLFSMSNDDERQVLVERVSSLRNRAQQRVDRLESIMLSLDNGEEGGKTKT